MHKHNDTTPLYIINKMWKTSSYISISFILFFDIINNE